MFLFTFNYFSRVSFIVALGNIKKDKIKHLLYFCQLGNRREKNSRPINTKDTNSNLKNVEPRQLFGSTPLLTSLYLPT
jgi:hypothetical protein